MTSPDCQSDLIRMFTSTRLSFLKPNLFRVPQTHQPRHLCILFLFLLRSSPFFFHLSNPTHPLKLSSGVQLQKLSLNSPDSKSSTILSILHPLNKMKLKHLPQYLLYYIEIHVQQPFPPGDHYPKEQSVHLCLYSQNLALVFVSTP